MSSFVRWRELLLAVKNKSLLLQLEILATEFQPEKNQYNRDNQDNQDNHDDHDDQDNQDNHVRLAHL